MDKKYIFMKNDPKKGPNPSKRDEILAEGFDGLLAADPPVPEPRCERRPPAPEQPRGGRRVRHGRYQLLEEEAVAPPRSGHSVW